MPPCVPADVVRIVGIIAHREALSATSIVRECRPLRLVGQAIPVPRVHRGFMPRGLPNRRPADRACTASFAEPCKPGALPQCWKERRGQVVAFLPPRLRGEEGGCHRSKDKFKRRHVAASSTKATYFYTFGRLITSAPLRGPQRFRHITRRPSLQEVPSGLPCSACFEFD